jgi:undecaprenyl-diphosphatase
VLFDRSVDALFVRAPGFDHRVARVLSEVGDPKVFVTVTAVIAATLILLGDYRAAVTAVGSVVLGLVLVEEVFKPFFDRHLSSWSGPTFPSGHTTVSVALAGAVMLAARGARPLGRLLGPALSWLLMVVVAVVSCAIGLGMVVLGMHYISDVATGVPLGVAVTGCTAVLVDVVAARLARRTGAMGLVVEARQPDRPGAA